MRIGHLTREVLERFVARGYDEDEQLFFLHHLAVCPECHRIGGGVLELFEAGALDVPFSSVDLALASSRAVAPALLARLERFPQTKALGLVRDARRFQSWGLAELLAKESVREAGENPTRAVELAELSVAVALALRPGAPGEADWLGDLRAYAWAHLGNARRVSGELRSAAAAFAVADRHWVQGAARAGDALGYEAWILCLKVSLRLTEGRLEEALVLLDEALEADTAHALTGTLLVNKARVFEELNDLPGAIQLLEEAAAFIDSATQPRLLLCARHNLLDALSKAGRFAEGEHLLPEVRELAVRCGGEIDSLRLRWVEGRVVAGRGKVEEAISLFHEVRQVFLDRGLGFDSALASLELAVILLSAGRPEEACALAAEMLPVFLVADVHREALAALVVFREAAARNELTLDLARRIHHFLLRARQNPALRFEH